MSNAKKTVPSLSKDIKSELETMTQIATKIRFLKSKSFSTGDISRILTETEGRLIRYQWVRNVLLTPLKNG